MSPWNRFLAGPFYGPLYTKTKLPRRYASGLDDFDGLLLHVSSGVGMERGAAPQIRFLCPPEICVLELQAEDDNLFRNKSSEPQS